VSREQDLDRNEEATPHKLEEARKEGNTARSTDATSLAVLSVAMVACFALVYPAVQDMARLLAKGLALDPTVAMDAARVSRVAGDGFHAALLVLAPLLFAIVVVVVVSGLLQSGFIFSTKPLTPDFTRINPASGFKKLFSVRLLYEAVKSSLKLTALIAVAWLALRSMLAVASHWFNLPAKAFLFQFGDVAGSLLAKLCAVLLVFMLIDLVFVRWDFGRNMRMSRREVEDEHKNREGDPRIKNRQREIRLQFLRRSSSVQNVPQASVVITNPTHIAVALKYEHGVSPAPQIVAKGAGSLAKHIKLAANKAGVPVVHSPMLARALFKDVPEDGYVPEKWYPPVAKILVWLRAAREVRQEAHAGAAR
jgi:flagellar biosynthesis protein FlhB